MCLIRVRLIGQLDITGEIDVFEAAKELDADAKAAGVVVMPGVGFDVVPTDCMAAHLQGRLPTATSLTLAFHGIGGSLSHGTASTVVEALAEMRPGVVRRNGKLVDDITGTRRRVIDHGYGIGRVLSTAIPWGDVSTAYSSTKIPNITVYTGTPGFAAFALWVGSFTIVRWLLATALIQWFIRKLIPQWGPSAERRARAFSCVWGEAVDDATGKRVASRLRVADGYTFTALAAIRVAENLQFRLPRRPAGSGARLKKGFMTPSMAYGPELVLSIEGSTREDIPDDEL